MRDALFEMRFKRITHRALRMNFSSWLLNPLHSTSSHRWFYFTLYGNLMAEDFLALAPIEE